MHNKPLLFSLRSIRERGTTSRVLFNNNYDALTQAMPWKGLK
jgi:hypothetical protein